MPSDKEIAIRALDFQARAKDYPLCQIPNYTAWSERKLSEGVSPALIAHLDATGMMLLPEELAGVEECIFDEMLEELKELFGE